MFYLIHKLKNKLDLYHFLITTRDLVLTSLKTMSLIVLPAYVKQQVNVVFLVSLLQAAILIEFHLNICDNLNAEDF